MLENEVALIINALKVGLKGVFLKTSCSKTLSNVNRHGRKNGIMKK
jgi:hypothetical protein